MASSHRPRVPRKSARQAVDDEWDKHRDEITLLYDQHTLEEVISLMREKYRFEARYELDIRDSIHAHHESIFTAKVEFAASDSTPINSENGGSRSAAMEAVFQSNDPWFLNAREIAPSPNLESPRRKERNVSHPGIRKTATRLHRQTVRLRYYFPVRSDYGTQPGLIFGIIHIVHLILIPVFRQRSSSKPFC
jgi:Clr5-like protein